MMTLKTIVVMLHFCYLKPTNLDLIVLLQRREMAPKIYYADRYYFYPQIDLLSLLFGKQLKKV